MYADEDLGLDPPNRIYALDSTTIDLCKRCLHLSLFPWAPFRRTNAAVKMHTPLDLRGSIPSSIHISDGKLRDVNVLDEVVPPPTDEIGFVRVTVIPVQKGQRWTPRTHFNTRDPTLVDRVATEYYLRPKELHMTVKSSISLTDEQHAFARTLVEDGRYSSISAGLQRGVDLLRQRVDAEDLETLALRELLADRRKGEFVDGDQMDARLAATVSETRRAHGFLS